MPSSCEDTSHTGYGPTHKISFYLYYFFQSLISKYRHILRYGERAKTSTYGFGVGSTIQPDRRCTIRHRDQIVIANRDEGWGRDGLGIGISRCKLLYSKFSICTFQLSTFKDENSMQLSYCTTVLFKVLYCNIKIILFFYLFYMLFVIKSIINVFQYSTI